MNAFLQLSCFCSCQLPATGLPRWKRGKHAEKRRSKKQYLSQEAAYKRQSSRVVLGTKVQVGQASLDSLSQEGALLRACPVHLLLAYFELQHHQQGPSHTAMLGGCWRSTRHLGLSSRKEVDLTLSSRGTSTAAQVPRTTTGRRPARCVVYVRNWNSKVICITWL